MRSGPGIDSGTGLGDGLEAANQAASICVIWKTNHYNGMYSMRGHDLNPRVFIPLERRKPLRRYPCP